MGRRTYDQAVVSSTPGRVGSLSNGSWASTYTERCGNKIRAKNWFEKPRLLGF